MLTPKVASGPQPAVPASSPSPAALLHASAEGNIFDNLSAIVDSALSHSLHEKAGRLPQLRDRLLQHQRGMFACATEAGCKQKERDWLTYCHLMHGNKIPDLDSMPWPPSEEEWLKFLQDGRKQVSSHERLTRWAGNVAEVGSRYFRRVRQHRAATAKELDPRKLYFLEHVKMLRILKREYGVELRQVAGIDMVEARNFGYFVDLDSVVGLSQAASFAMGCLFGGRRPRTLTSIKLRDCRFFADAVQIDGQRTLVPGVHITFEDEKVDDIQGPRAAKDSHAHKSSYAGWHLMSPAYYLYQLLVRRGAFKEWDPLVSAHDKAELPIAKHAQDWYLLCSCTPDTWVDTLPVSVAILGCWTKAILRRMGRPPRGFSAHRRGCITRACILCILNSKGKELPLSELNAMVRWGGWTGVTGVMTVMRTYACKVIDEFLDVYGLAYGRQNEQDEWQAKLHDFIGPQLRPQSAIVQPGCRPLHLQVKMDAWRLPVWQQVQRQLNACGRHILSAARKDAELLPVRRFREDRRLLNAACSKYAESLVVKHLLELQRHKRRTFSEACRQAAELCLEAWQSTQAWLRSFPMAVTRQRLLCQMSLAPWVPGCVTHAGRVQTFRLEENAFLFL